MDEKTADLDADSRQTCDTLLRGRVRLLQPARGYRAAIDPVFLAAACPATPGAHVLELGSGTGAASLCLAARVDACDVTGVERQAGALALARQSAALNGLDRRVRFVEGDNRDLPKSVPPQAFDHVIANPPFYESADYSPGVVPDKTAAHAMEARDLADWIGSARRCLKPGGTLTLLLATRQVPEALSLIRERGFGGIALAPLWPRAGENAKRAVLIARDQSRAPFSLQAGLVLHALDGAYTPGARAVLEDGKSLAEAMLLRQPQ